MANTNILPIAPSVEPEVSRPDAGKLISGDPVHTTWNLEERDGLYCGIWQSTPGKWSIALRRMGIYAGILEGVSGDLGWTAADAVDGGRPGDSIHFLRPGFKGSWEVPWKRLARTMVIKL